MPDANRPDPTPAAPTEPVAEPVPRSRWRFSRRRALGVSGAGIAGAAVGLAAYFVLSARADTGLPPLVVAAAGLVVGGVALVLAGLVGIVPMTAGTGDVQLAGLTTPWWVPVAGLSLVAAAFAYASGVSATRRASAERLSSPETRMLRFRSTRSKRPRASRSGSIGTCGRATRS